MARSLVVLLSTVFGLLGLIQASQVDLGYSQSDLVSESSISALFDRWCAEHGKVYENAAERLARSQIFKERLLQVDAHNQDGKQLYKQGLNQFSDLSSEERRAAFPQMKVSDLLGQAPASKKGEKASRLAAALPASVDWRSKGAVTRVKDVGQCKGAIWAYAAVGAVEGSLKVNGYPLADLSAQQLLDCDPDPANRKCISGLATRAFDYIQEQGIVKEKAYPFTGSSNATCKPATGELYTITGAEERIDDLKAGVAQQPIVIAIDGSSDDFINYKSGIFTGACNEDLAGQWLLVVGYGTQNGTDYWLLKNAWGFAWGENGYMRLKQGSCGDSNFGAYPTGAAIATKSLPCSTRQTCPSGMSCCCRDPVFGPAKGTTCKSYMCCPKNYPCEGGCCGKSTSIQQEELIFVAGNQTVASH